MLSDRDIKVALAKGDITIEDFDPARLQPASYDVLLGNEFMIFNKNKLEIIDPKQNIQENMIKVEIADGDYFVLQAKEFALGMTRDFVGVSEAYACEIMGKSSLARLGLIIHTTAGFIDPGNQLRVTLELFNTNDVAIKLYPGMKVAQIAFTKLSSPAERAYGDKSLGSKYYNARGVQASNMFLNFNKKAKSSSKK